MANPLPSVEFEISINLNKLEATVYKAATTSVFGMPIPNEQRKAVPVYHCKIAAGKLGNWSPSSLFSSGTIVVRPPYTATDGGEKSGPDLSMPGEKVKNALGRVLLFIVDDDGVHQGPYRGHGTSHPESMGSYASGGCIRFTPKDSEEIARIIMKEEGKDFDALLAQKKTIYAKVNPFKVRMNYTCWELNGVSLQNGNLFMTILPDPYGVLKVDANGKPAAEIPPDGCPFNLRLNGNAITFTQFKETLAQNGLVLSAEKSESDLRTLYLRLRQEVTKFTKEALAVKNPFAATVKINKVETQIVRRDASVKKGLETRKVKLQADGILEYSPAAANPKVQMR